MIPASPLLVIADAVTATSPAGLALRDQFVGFRLVAARQRAEALLDTAQAPLDSRDDDVDAKPWSLPADWWKGERHDP